MISIYLDGSFCDWSTYSVCTSCINGHGYQERSRDCNCPPPSNGGLNCTPSGESNATFTYSGVINIETQRLSCDNCSISKSNWNFLHLKMKIEDGNLFDRLATMGCHLEFWRNLFVVFKKINLYSTFKWPQKWNASLERTWPFKYYYI